MAESKNAEFSKFLERRAKELLEDLREPGETVSDTIKRIKRVCLFTIMAMSVQEFAREWRSK